MAQARMSTAISHPSRPLKTMAPIVVALTSVWLAACVPVPYRPAASVTHVAIAPEDAAATVLAVDSVSGVTQPVAKSLRHEEPRVVIVDPAAFMTDLAPAG